MKTLNRNFSLLGVLINVIRDCVSGFASSYTVAGQHRIHTDFRRNESGEYRLKKQGVNNSI